MCGAAGMCSSLRQTCEVRELAHGHTVFLGTTLLCPDCCGGGSPALAEANAFLMWGLGVLAS